METEAVKKMSQPTNITEFNHFLVIAKFFRKFVPNLDDMAEQLHSMLKADTTWIWDPNEEKSWSHSSFALPETETPFRASLIRFFTALFVPAPTPPFLSLPQGVELRLPFTPLDNRTPGGPTTKLPCPQWSIPTVGWFLSFITTGAIQV
ncbi:hypothetical protein AVEN_139040-1 [Araneus ventricosus]|uniref:Uncharacterized protein n=1 Tax=Araneus ventricosus TaxID=182803 RepID=A0A4Y2FV05_ARAVE|nr:hypothetical protein AVEN_139040-1 [Araneus ventricosus]